MFYFKVLARIIINGVKVFIMSIEYAIIRKRRFIGPQNLGQKKHRPSEVPIYQIPFWSHNRYAIGLILLCNGKDVIPHHE